MPQQQQQQTQPQQTLEIAQAMEILQGHLRANPRQLAEIVVSMASAATGMDLAD